MGLKAVYRVPDSPDQEKVGEEISARIEALGGQVAGHWSGSCAVVHLPSRDEPESTPSTMSSSAGGGKQALGGRKLYVVSLPGVSERERQRVGHVCVDDIIMEARGDLGAFLHKTETPPSRLMMDMQGLAFHLHDFIIRVGTAVIASQLKGHILEVEYLPFNSNLTTQNPTPAAPAGAAAGGAGDNASDAVLASVLSAVFEPLAQSLCPGAAICSSAAGGRKGTQDASVHDHTVRQYMELFNMYIRVAPSAPTTATAAVT